MVDRRCARFPGSFIAPETSRVAPRLQHHSTTGSVGWRLCFHTYMVASCRSVYALNGCRQFRRRDLILRVLQGGADVAFDDRIGRTGPAVGQTGTAVRWGWVIDATTASPVSARLVRSASGAARPGVGGWARGRIGFSARKLWSLHLFAGRDLVSRSRCQ